MIDLMLQVEQVSWIDKPKLQKFLNFIIESLQKIPFNETQFQWPSIKYHSFGSQGNGFGTNNSDIDLTLITDHYIPEVSSLKFIFRNLKRIVADKKCKIYFIRHAKVPLITLYYRGQNVDIIMNNLLGILNSKLLKSYSLLHEKVKAGGILLKLWGKQNKVIRKPRISSYAMILMWICFLQRKYALPDLQDQIYVSTLKQKQGDYMINIKRTFRKEYQNFKTDPRFVFYKEPLFKELQQKCSNLNNIDIEQLLLKFWEYYTIDGEFLRKKQKISIHYSEQMDEKYPFSIIDPFDHKSDPGKKLGRKLLTKKIWPKFIEASQTDVQQTFKFLR
ncbi:hypothetical protein pb186bvf_020283 [Paramecium bursaria]